LFVVLGIQQVMRMRLIVICSLPGSTTFFYILSYKAQYLETLLNTECVFCFYLQLYFLKHFSF